MKLIVASEIQSLINYLEKNNYSYNEKASLIAGHRTQSALVALFGEAFR